MEEVKKARQTATVPEYARMSDSTPKKVRTLCESGILPAYKTNGGQWRIFVNDSGVSWETYKKALERISYLETKLKSMKAISADV